MISNVVGRAVRSIRRRALTLQGLMLTQSEKQRAGDAAHFWSESEQDETIQGLSHWRGAGRYSDDRVWLAIGEEHLKQFETLQYLTKKGPIDSMIEWGPGGGSNAVAFSSTVSKFYGVDISQANLDECKRQLSAAGFSGFHPVLVDPSDLSKVKSTCKSSIDPVDFFLSVAVFQHFPSKEFGLDVLSVARSQLKPDGIALIQTRYDDGTRRTRSKTANYRHNAIFFTSYGIEEFWDAAVARGFKPLAVILVPGVCYAYYFLSCADIPATESVDGKL